MQSRFEQVTGISDWDEMSLDQQRSAYMKQMTFHHSQRVIEPSPIAAIEKLTSQIEKSSESSEKLTRSISRATWLAGIVAFVALVITILDYIIL